MVRAFKISFIKQHIIFKLLSIFLFIATLLSINYWSNSDFRMAKRCFENTQIAEKLLIDDIMVADKKPIPGKTIFFHETSCLNGRIRLNARQACAIESAAKMNPTWEVFLLFASPISIDNDSITPIIDALFTYPNINLRNVNLWTYVRDTPIDDWMNDGSLFYSKFLNSHTSDVLRYLSLYKWGGTYLDLDVVVQKSFENISPNYAGAESNEFVAAGIINFDHKNVGHEIAEMCLRELQMNFNGEDWGNNGPGVITRVLRRICQTNLPKLMTRERCRGFKVFPSNAFYAIPWENWRQFFSAKFTNSTLMLTRDSIAIHVWNKHSKDEVIHVNPIVKDENVIVSASANSVSSSSLVLPLFSSSSAAAASGVVIPTSSVTQTTSVTSPPAYGQIAEEFCPKVFRSCGKYF